MIKFKDVPPNGIFYYNGNMCRKVSSRTALLVEYGRVFYYGSDEVVYMTDKPMLERVPCVVRINKDNQLESFYYNKDSHGRKRLECFTKQEGHSEYCIEYYKDTKPCKDYLQAQSFVDSYNRMAPQDGVIFVLKQRLQH